MHIFVITRLKWYLPECLLYLLWRKKIHCTNPLGAERRHAVCIFSLKVEDGWHFLEGRGISQVHNTSDWVHMHCSTKQCLLKVHVLLVYNGLHQRGTRYLKCCPHFMWRMNVCEKQLVRSASLVSSHRLRFETSQVRWFSICSASDPHLISIWSVCLLDSPLWMYSGLVQLADRDHTYGVYISHLGTIGIPPEELEDVAGRQMSGPLHFGS